MEMSASEQRERRQFEKVVRKKNFVCLEKVGGGALTKNILDGLELHAGVFSSKEQMVAVDWVYHLEREGRKGRLREHTYTESKNWAPATLQFGCCHDRVDKEGKHHPGVARAVEADPIPAVFQAMIRRLARWHVLPAGFVPDSCEVRIHERGDCVPHRADSPDFLRPVCTVSLLGVCDVQFGAEMAPKGWGEFCFSAAVPMPAGSALVLKGRAADVAQHCFPIVTDGRRITVTFRKMASDKVPVGYSSGVMDEEDAVDVEGISMSPPLLRLDGKMASAEEKKVLLQRKMFRGHEGKTEVRYVLVGGEGKGSDDYYGGRKKLRICY